ncbi:MAG: sigma 54-interacting transcriptional regulator, partial [Pseudomonadales bacterium]
MHKLSSQSNRPMVNMNGPTLPLTLIESERFGHQKGASSDAPDANPAVLTGY